MHTVRYRTAGANSPRPHHARGRGALHATEKGTRNATNTRQRNKEKPSGGGTLATTAHNPAPTRRVTTSAFARRPFTHSSSSPTKGVSSSPQPDGGFATSPAPAIHSPALRSNDDSNDPNTESTSHPEATGRPRNTRRTPSSFNTTLDPSRATTLNATLTPSPEYSDRRTPSLTPQPAATVTVATLTPQPGIKKPRSILRVRHTTRLHSEPNPSIPTQHAHATIHVHHTNLGRNPTRTLNKVNARPARHDVHTNESQHGAHMRPALAAPHMSAPKLVASHEAHRAAVSDHAHATAARHTRRHLAATNTPNKTMFRFPPPCLPRTRSQTARPAPHPPQRHQSHAGTTRHAHPPPRTGHAHSRHHQTRAHQQAHASHPQTARTQPGHAQDAQACPTRPTDPTQAHH